MTMSYSAVVLDEDSKLALQKFMKNFFNISNSWEMHCDHMTIKMGALPPEMKDDIGRIATLTVTHIGRSDLVTAVKVEGYKSFNKIPHITLMVNKKGGGRPVMSNDITEWASIVPFTLSGEIKEIPYK